MNTPTRQQIFRERVRRGDRLLGTFIKTPHPAVVEVLGGMPLDCLCIDAEHAPFDRTAIDLAVLAARVADMPTLVRVSRPDPAEILNALDLGATGVVIPHVSTPEAADAAAAACRYGQGGRGYSGGTRAAGFGSRSMPDNVDRANAEVTLIAQIEDAAAVENIDSIAAIDGVDLLFIGRMDLAVSLGARSPDDAVVIDAVDRICAAARRHKRALGMFTPTVEEARRWADSGASLFLLQSDQQWLQQGALALRRAFGN